LDGFLFVNRAWKKHFFSGSGRQSSSSRRPDVRRLTEPGVEAVVAFLDPGPSRNAEDAVLQFRAVQERDWPMIVWLASNEIQEADHSGLDVLWVEGRRSFKGVRRQTVVESDGSIVGYCSIEQDSLEQDSIEQDKDDAPNSYCVFLVADWNR